MPEEMKEASCPRCGEKKKWTWQGWTWRTNGKGSDEYIKDVHQRRCACGKLYGVIDKEGYKNKMEEENK